MGPEHALTSWKLVAPPPRTAVEPGTAPGFSVVIACYQAAPTIGEALGSAFAQTVQPQEVVVCDDGSTDDLDAALAPFADRIVLLRHERNQGAGAAKNDAIRAARGEFVVFLDADDVFYPQRLEALSRLAAMRPDLDVLTTNADLDVDGHVVARYYPQVARFPVDEQRQGVLADDSAVFSAAAVRRERVLACGGFDPGLSHSSDWECWMRLALDGALFGLVDAPLYRYRLHATSMTADRAQAWRTNLPVLEQMLRHPRATADDRATLRSTHARYLRLALLTEAEEALRKRSRDARGRARAVATGAGFGPATRLKAAFAVAFPGIAARLLERRERRTGRSRLLRELPKTG